ncbi:MAG TPA: SDR family oxidoreductase, partial [Blastocatellia bacterium]|nr:SDR family oxidoreductase [Blastocatellia bacterium]
PPGSREESRLIDRLMTEIQTGAPDVVTTYRGNRRWVQSYEPLPLERNAQPVRSLRTRGVYLITGGLGGVGLLIAGHLARSVQARLVLTGRAPFPDRRDWAQWLASHDSHDEISIKILKLQEMEEAGAEIVIANVDVTDENRMQALVAKTLRQFGALHGVLHAAGITSGSSVFNPYPGIGIAETELQFQPKAYGLYVLERALKGIALDFCLLFSSNASVLGGLGFAAYAAANTFMDAFASSRDSANGVPWISATWDPWPEETKKYTGYQTSMDRYTMTVEESLEAFNRLVTSAPEGQVIVSTGDLTERLSLWLNRDAARDESQPAGEPAIHPRPSLDCLYVAPRNKTEETMVEIWRQILGLEQVGIHDNFFNLGGHSLLAMRLVSRMREAFQVELPVGKFFQSPTVAGLAQAISDLQAEQQDQEKKELLSILSQLTDDEIRSEIERQTTG